MTKSNSLSLLKKIKASPSTHDFRKVNANNLINGSIRFYKLFKHQICVIEGMKKIINWNNTPIKKKLLIFAILSTGS